MAITPPCNGAPIRVLLVEDQRILREGLRTILELEPDIEVVGEAENGRIAVEAAARIAPDVVLMDLKMPVMDGVEATRRILAGRSETQVVILTTYDHDSLVLDALRAGARGYLLKDDPADEMIRAIHLAHRGESLLQPSVAAKLLAVFQGTKNDAGTVTTEPDSWRSVDTDRLPAPVGDCPLTDRERQVLQLVAEGASNLQIARKLHLAEGTVKNHISLIMDKLGASNRTQAVTIARQRRLIG
jgi:DNA-binding NarL/FixJ family response regulator